VFILLKVQAGLSTVASVAGGESSREVLGGRDKPIRLVEVTDADGTEHFTVELLDEHGSVAESTDYAHDDFPLAVRDFTWRGVDLLGYSTESSVIAGLRMITAIEEGDGEALAVALHDDFLMLDHRLIGYPELDKAAMIEAVLLQNDVHQIWLSETVDAASETASLTLGSFWTRHYGRWSPYERGVYITVARDGQVSLIEVYPDDQLDDALDRYSELSDPNNTEG
jgi:hypothetical protein